MAICTHERVTIHEHSTPAPGYWATCRDCQRSGPSAGGPERAREAIRDGIRDGSYVSISEIDHDVAPEMCPRCGYDTVAEIAHSGYRHAQCLFCGAICGDVTKEGDDG